MKFYLQMKINKFLAILCCAFLATAVVSCHKDSDDDDTEYLSGTLTFSIPTYLSPGDELTLIPEGEVTTTSGGTVGYYWYTSEDTAKDTTRFEKDPVSVTGNFDFVVPEDFTGRLTVYCVAFAEGFYNKSAANTIAVVDDSSLSIPGLSDEDPMFVDERDGKSYRYVTIGGLDWMAENLSYGSRPFLGYEVLQGAFGCMYTWEEAMASCPDGWRLPDQNDWASLSAALESEGGVHDIFKGLAGKLMTNGYFNDVKLWDFIPAVKITGESKMNLLPYGYGVMDDDGEIIYDGFGKYCVLWTAEESREDKAYYRYIYEELPDVSLGEGSKTYFIAPVRCVRNAE